MRKRGNKITFATSLLILVCLIGSFTFPQYQIYFKVMALLAFAFACVMSLVEEKQKGVNITANVIVMSILIAVVAYLFFF